MSFTALNPSDKSNVTLSNSNRTGTSTQVGGARAVDIQYKGKFYVEFKPTTIALANTGAGLLTPTRNGLSTAGSATHAAFVNRAGAIFVDSVTQAGNLGSFSAGTSTLCMAVDLTANLIWFRRDAGNWNADSSANPATGIGGYDISVITPLGVWPFISFQGGGEVITANFGTVAFAQTVPSGFIAGWVAGTEAFYVDPVSLNATTTWTNPGTSATITVTTQGLANTKLFLFVHLERGTSAPTVSGVSSANTSGWTLRNRFSFTTSGNVVNRLEIWETSLSAALNAEVITVTGTSAVDDATILSCAIAGVATAVWDADGSLPATSSTNASTSGSVTGVSTALARSIVLGQWGSSSGQNAPAAGTGFLSINSAKNVGGSNFSVQLLEGAYKTAKQSSATVTTGTYTSEPSLMQVNAVDAANQGIPLRTFATLY